MGCAEVDGTAEPDAVSLGVVLKYFKSASEERREVYVTTACYILIKKQMLGVLYMRLIMKMWWDSFKFIVIAMQFSLTTVQKPVKCSEMNTYVYIAYEWYVKAKVWNINSNTL